VEVGLAAQLPSGEYAEDNLNHRTLWQFLLAKGQAYEKIPQNRLEQLSWVQLQAASIWIQPDTFQKYATRLGFVSQRNH
jgi:hypothetical protein